MHRRHRCYPEVWGRGLKGPWHCTKCHPCGLVWERRAAEMQENVRWEALAVEAAASEGKKSSENIGCHKRLTL